MEIQARRSKHITVTAKRFLLAVIGAVLLIGFGLVLAPSGSRRYRADSRVVAKPYTNTLLARSFEAHVIRAIPGTVLSGASSRLPDQKLSRSSRSEDESAEIKNFRNEGFLPVDGAGLTGLRPGTKEDKSNLNA